MTNYTSDETQAFFPLNTVLFPGGILPLQIFEQRYLNLVKTCMKQDTGFIVVLINTGKEVNDTPEIFSMGTYANIIDWESLDGGLLGITVQGARRVQLRNATAKDDGLLVGYIDEIEDNGTSIARISEVYDDLVKTLQEFSKHPFVAQRYADIDYTSANDVCNKLSELLPISNIQKQELLETLSINQRLEKLQTIIRELSN